MIPLHNVLKADRLRDWSLSRVTRNFNFAKFAAGSRGRLLYSPTCCCLTVTWRYGVIESGCTHRLETYVVGSDDDWTVLNNPGQSVCHPPRIYVGGFQGAKFHRRVLRKRILLGRTSSPIREKTASHIGLPRNHPNTIAWRACIRVPWARSKIIGSNYPSKGIFIRKLRELICKLKIHVRAKKRKYYLLWCMKCFATIISPKKANNKKILHFFQFLLLVTDYTFLMYAAVFVSYIDYTKYIIEFLFGVKKDTELELI